MKDQEKKNLVYHGYNHPMLYYNIFDKNYICVSKTCYHIEGSLSNQSIYIGEAWMDVHFSEKNPMAVYKNFYDFLKGVKAKYGGVKGLYSKYPEGVKIFAGPNDAKPFIFYALAQIEKSFDFQKNQINLILKKLNERFWIWDRMKMELSFETYQKFKKDIGGIQLNDTVLKKNEVLKLPIEYLLMLYQDKKLSEEYLLRKIDLLKSDFLEASVRNMSRHISEIVMNDPRIFKEYRGINIESMFDVVSFLEKDAFLNKLLVERIDKRSVVWIEKNKDEIEKLLQISKKYDLVSQDALPVKEEFKILCQLFFSKQNRLKILQDLLNGHFSSKIHEMTFFYENHNKVNTTLINYLSLQIQKLKKTNILA